MRRNESGKEGEKAFFAEGAAVVSSIKDKAELAGGAHGESEQEAGVSPQARVAWGLSARWLIQPWARSLDRGGGYHCG